MKKIYLSFFLLLINVSVFSQETLPYAYDFEGDFQTTGWHASANIGDTACFNSLPFLFGQSTGGYFVFASGYQDCGSDYSQYLVSPQLINSTFDSVQICFKYKAAPPANTSSYEAETFVVGYYAGNQYASVDDFIWSEDTFRTTNYTDWQTFVYNFPPTASYVAIAYTSDFASGLMIDDVLLRTDMPEVTHLFEVIAGYGGTVSVTTDGVTTNGSAMVAEGADLTCTISADPGYVIDSVFVDGTYFAAPHSLTEYIYTFQQVDRNHTISVSFLHQPYIVHYTSTGNGTISVTGGVPVGLDSVRLYYEDTLTFHFIPDEGYELADLQLNGASVGVADTYVLTHLLQNTLFHVVFEERTFSIVSYSHNSGTIMPPATGAVGYLDTVWLAVTPNYCMQVDSILFDGSRLDVADALCFTHLEGSHVLNAYFSQIYYTMQMQTAEHGTIVGNESVVCDGTARLRLVPDPCYRFSHFYLDGEQRDDLVRTINDTARVSIANISADHSVTADFERLEYQVSVTSSGNGSVFSSALGNVLCDTVVRVEAIPDECHYVASFMVNGTDVMGDVQHAPSASEGVGDTIRYDLAGIRNDQSVAVEFRQLVFPLVVNAGPNGISSITDTAWVVCGQDTALRFVPDECYRVDAVLLDGADMSQELVHVGDTVCLTLRNAQSPHTLDVSFGLKHYTVSIVSGENGGILPSADTVVECGASLPLIFVPASCYRIDTVWLDGSVVANSHMSYKHNADHHFGDSAFYALNDITEDHEVRATFKRMVYHHDISVIGNGTVTSSETGSSVYCGEAVTVTMTPDDCHQIKEVYLNNEQFTDYQLDENGVGTCYFSEAVSDLYLSVEFERKYHTISVVAHEPANGEIISPDTAVSCGNDILLQFVPDGCYHLDSVRIGDEWIQMENRIAAGDTFSYQIQNIHSDYVVDASFSIDSVHFTVSSGAPMSVSDTVLACGQRLTVYTIHDICDRLDSIVWNGHQYWMDESQIGDIYYSLDTLYFNIYSLYEDCDFAVHFSPIVYRVRPHIEGAGLVGATSFSVACDDSLAIHIFPEDCHHLGSFTVSDGCSYTLYGDTLLVVRDLWRELDISFTFVSDEYEVQLTYNSDLGTVEGATGMVDCGTDLVYTFHPATCAKLDSVFLDGVCVNERIDSSSGLALVIDSVSADHDLRAVFSGIIVSIDVSADDHAYAVVTPQNVFDCGEDLTLYIEPMECYDISEVLFDGGSVVELLNHEEDGYTFRLYRVRQNHRFEVYSAPVEYPIMVNRLTETGDVLSSDTSSILCGSDTTLAAIPFDDCYVIDSVYLNDVRMDVQSEYLCSAVSGPTTLNVFMHRIEYKIEVTDYAHCSITEGQSLQMVLCDSSLHLAFVPDEGYSIISLVVDGEEILEITGYDFLNVHEDHTVSVRTEPYHYVVRASSVGAGSITPDSMTVDYGDNAELRIVPGECQYLSQVTVNGQSYLDSVSYGDGYALLVIRGVTEDLDVVATFEQLEYYVRSDAHLEGSVIPSMGSVMCGEPYQFYIVASECYHVDTVFVGGTPFTEGWFPYNDDTLGFIIPEVKEDVYVDVSFAKDVKSIVLNNGEGGTVLLSDTTFLCGDGYSMKIIPDSCRTLESVTVNGEDVMHRIIYMMNIYFSFSDTAFYEVTGVYDDQLIEIVYGIKPPHHIGVSFLSDGNMLSYNDIEVGCGEDTLISLTYDCYTLDSLFVDGIRTAPEREFQFSDVLSNHMVDAYFSRNYYEIVAIDAAHGAITPSDTAMVACGGNKTYTITPDEGYYIGSLIIDGEVAEAAASYTFADVHENHTIEPVFVSYMYAVNVETVGAGSVTPGDTSVMYGSDIHYEIVADDCHSIDSVVVNGINRGAVDSYDCISITAPQTLTAYFSMNEYAVTIGSSEHGEIILDTAAVACGGSVNITVVPDACYELDSVLVNGLNVGAVTSYQIGNIIENQEVSAYFSQISYSVIVDDNILHGTVTPSAEQVLCGENVTLSVLPEPCYSLDSLIVNGVNVGSEDAYVISEMDMDQYVTAYFSMNEYSVEVLAGSNGSVTNTGTNVVACGDGFSVTIVPEECYRTGEVLVDGRSVEPQDNVVALDSVTSDHRIEVTFERIMYPQHVTAGFGGSVIPAAPSVACGDDQLFVVTPINCYHIDTVWLNGEVLPFSSMEFNGDTASFTLEDIHSANEIVAHFASNNYRFEVENHGNGIVHLEQNSVECDGEATFYILPAACERIGSVLLNDADITNDLDYHANVNPLLPDTAFYTIGQMNEDKQLVIDYQSLPDNNVTVTYTDGSVTLYAADSLLSCGENIRLDFNYDCYTVDSVTLDGENQGAVQSLSVESNLSDRVVVAYFTMNVYDIVATATEGGSIEPDGPLSLSCGGSRSFNIVPDACYSIDSVVVNGVNEGVITSYAIENIHENQTISAFFSRNTYTVELQENEGGSLALGGPATIVCGGSVTVSVTPDACFAIDSVVVNGILLGNEASYTIDGITEDQTVAAYFSRNEYEVSAVAEEGGTITPEGNSTLVCGSEISYDITPEPCHQIDSVLVNGVNIGAVTTCTLTGTDELGDQNIRAFFSVISYPITFEAGEGGSVVPSADTSVACGTSLNVVIVPDECYSIDNVWIDGDERGALASYTFEDVSAPHTLSATFVMQEFILTPITRGGGSITPNVSTAVTCGSDFTFHFTPYAGYYVSGVVVDGDTLPASDSCLLTGIVANHTVQPLFSLMQFQITATAGEGGSVSPEYAVVDYQGLQTIRITADDCYHVDSVFVDDHYIGSTEVYTFNNVTDNHTLRAVFAINTYTLTASAEGEGTITPADDTIVDCGENVAYTFAASEGWHLTEVRVDGEPVDATESYTFTDVRANHAITATFAINEYTVTATAGEGGSVMPESTVVNYGDSVTIEIVAADCYHIDSVFVDEAFVGTGNSYTFRDIADNHTLRAVFAANIYTLTASAEGNGTITPAGDTIVDCGENVAYTFAASEGWHLTELRVDGELVGLTETYTFTDIHDNHAITATFAIDEYTVTATAGEGGSVMPESTVVHYGDSVTVAITADDCYHIDSVFVDEAFVGTESSYTFRDISDNHTLRAVFAANTYTITALVEGGGTITPAGDTTVLCGDDVTYSIAAAEGWTLVEVRVDGELVDSTETYTFTEVRDDHTISALFIGEEYTVTATAGEGGIVTPERTFVNHGDSVTIKIVADNCHHIDSVFVDEVYAGSDSSYTFRNISEDHTLRAVFASSTYTLTASAEGEGTITPAGDTTLSCGKNFTYSIAAAEGWHLAALRVDGELVDSTETYTFTDIRADHTITATFSIDQYTVTATAGEGGSVTPEHAVVESHGRQTIRITADECHHIDSVFVDDHYVGSAVRYTFNNVVADHTLRAVFAINTYTLTASVEGEGMITPAGDTTVDCGGNVTYTIAASEGWHLAELRVDGEPVDATESYTFTNVRANHAITATFAISEYTVTATAGEGGSVMPESTVVHYGDSVTVTITADDCHHIDSVFVDEVFVGTESSYTFRNIADNHTLRAVFATDTYTLTASVEGEGTITPAGETTVDCGDDITYSIAAFEGWHLTEVRVDDERVDSTESYTFTDVRANHAITATFAINQYTVTATAGEGGSVMPESTVVNYGDSVTVTITADDCHHIDSVFVDEAFVGTESSYTFRDIADNHTLRAVFATDTYTLTASVEGDGTITPVGDTIVDCDDNVTYSIAASEGWHLTELRVDGELVGLTETYTFTDIHANHAITATFAIDEYTVTATSGEGGSVMPESTVVHYGDSVTIAITADDCHHIDSVFVDGAFVGTESSYTFRDIADNHTLRAVFAQNRYDINVMVVSEEDEVLYDMIVNLLCGTDTLIGIPSFECFYVDSIDINGTLDYSGDSVLIRNVHENMDVVFYLSREQFILTATKQGSGTMSPMDTVHAACDDAVTFNYVPDEGWYVENLVVDGVSLGTPASDSYTFYNIHENHTIEVFFAPRVYIITSSIDPIDAGQITPYGMVPVTYGEDKTFNIMPFPGYEVVDVEVDGISQGAITTYTFRHVDANHTIVAHLVTVGVEEAVVNEEISVWPNPAEGVCHVLLPNKHNAEIQLFDAQGRLLLRQRADSDEVEIDLSQRPSGMYLLRVVSDGNVIATRKVIRK